MQKKILISSALVLAVLLKSVPCVSLQPPISVKWEGGVFLNDRVALQKEYDWSWQEYGLDASVEMFMFEKARAYATGTLRMLSFANDSQKIKSGSLPTEYVNQCTVAEAAVEINDFVRPGLTLSFGRQQINWGTAISCNPTDVWDVPDWQDFFNYGPRIGADCLKFDYSFGRYGLSLIVAIDNQKAIVPFGKFAPAFLPELGAVGATVVENIPDTNLEADYSLQNDCSAGLRFHGRIYDVQFSLSYAYCKDHFPLIKSVFIENNGVPNRMLVSTIVQSNDSLVRIKKIGEVFPRLHLLGFDCASAIGKLGIWAEAALLIPEQNVLYDLDLSPQYTGNVDKGSLINELFGTTSAQRTVPYCKFVAGLDYLFYQDLYCTLQFIHGLDNERDGNVGNYFSTSLDWFLYDKKVVFSPLGLYCGLGNFRDIKNSFCVWGRPQISWLAFERAKVSIGVCLLYAKASSRLNAVSTKNNECMAAISYSF